MTDLLSLGISLPAQPKRARKPTAAPRTRRSTPERDLQVSVIRYLKLALPEGGFAFAIKNEEAPRSADPIARMRFQMARRKTGMVRGIPDLCVVLPDARTAWIELKAGAAVTDAQEGIHERMRSLGHIVGVARSIDDVAALLRSGGVQLRARP